MLGLDVLEKATRTGTVKDSTALSEKIQHARVSVVVGKSGAETLVGRIKKRIENAKFIARMGITRVGNPDTPIKTTTRAKSSSTKTI